MSGGVTAIRTRLTVCSACGHHGRLIIATDTEVISRCHVCGDELRSGKAVAAAVPRTLLTARVPASA